MFGVDNSAAQSGDSLVGRNRAAAAFACPLRRAFPVVLVFVGAFAAQEALHVPAAAEYFVSPAGSDTATGTAPAAAFRTLACGLGRMVPGDTLTVLPGRYHESVSMKLSGGGGAPLTIRAAIPETAVLDGSLPLGDFVSVAGRFNVYECYLRQAPLQVIEVDTNRYLGPQPDVTGVERNPGSFAYDAERSVLTVQCTDASDPGRHVLAALVLRQGLWFNRAEGQEILPRLVIDGLVVCGFAEDGIALRYARDSVIRNCRVYDCGNGISLFHTEGTAIIDCITYRNGANNTFDEGGNIQIMGYTHVNNTVRGCHVFDSKHHGLRCYGRQRG